MWCLVCLETAISGSLCRLLKANALQVHISSDVDDLLDQLWFHGSDVACIVMEAQKLSGLDDLIDALTDWPILPVLAYGSFIDQIDPSIRNIHRRGRYCLDYVVNDINLFGNHQAFIQC